MNPFLRNDGCQVRCSIYSNSPSWQTRMCPIFMQWRPVTSQVLRLCDGAVCQETFLLVPYELGHPVSLTLPWPTSGDCACHTALQRPWDWQLWPIGPEGGQPARFPRGEAEQREMSTEGAPFLLVVIGRLKLGLTQQLNSGLETALIEVEVSDVSGVGDSVVLKNFKEKECNEKFMNAWLYFHLLHFVPLDCM